MGLCVTFVSGPRRSGKSAVIRMMIDHLWKNPPHYLRLAKIGSDKQPPSSAPGSAKECGVASARWIEYDDERVFEVLPEALGSIHKKDRYGSVIIEADADPILRCAYPYDHRIFVMPVPVSVRDVFRDAERAATELRRALDDTAAFAEEIFGLFAATGAEDPEPSEERAEFSATQMRGFLYSPLGDELATRIQLQPPYHGLVESDVVIVNTGAGEPGAETSACLRQIERLMDRLRSASGRRGELFLCEPLDVKGKVGKKLLKALEPMCKGGK